MKPNRFVLQQSDIEVDGNTEDDIDDTEEGNIEKGDYEGHPFRGNQFDGGSGEGGAPMDGVSEKEVSDLRDAVMPDDEYLISNKEVSLIEGMEGWQQGDEVDSKLFDSKDERREYLKAVRESEDEDADESSRSAARAKRDAMESHALTKLGAIKARQAENLRRVNAQLAQLAWTIKQMRKG